MMASLFGRSINRIAAQGLRTLLMLFSLDEGDEGNEAIRAFPLGGVGTKRSTPRALFRAPGRGNRVNRGQPIQGKKGSVCRGHQESNIQEPATI